MAPRAGSAAGGARTILIAVAIGLSIVIALLVAIILIPGHDDAPTILPSGTSSVRIPLAAPGLGPDGTRVPLFVAGEDGKEELRYVSPSGEGLELADGTYTIRAAGSPISGSGRVYQVPSETIRVVVRDGAVDDSDEVEPLEFRLIAPIDLTEGEVAEARELASGDDDAADAGAGDGDELADEADSLREAAADESSASYDLGNFTFQVPDPWRGLLSYEEDGDEAWLERNGLRVVVSTTLEPDLSGMEEVDAYVREDGADVHIYRGEDGRMVAVVTAPDMLASYLTVFSSEADEYEGAAKEDMAELEDMQLALSEQDEDADADDVALDVIEGCVDEVDQAVDEEVVAQREQNTIDMGSYTFVLPKPWWGQVDLRTSGTFSGADKQIDYQGYMLLGVYSYAHDYSFFPTVETRTLENGNTASITRGEDALLVVCIYSPSGQSAEFLTRSQFEDEPDYFFNMSTSERRASRAMQAAACGMSVDADPYQIAVECLFACAENVTFK